MPSFDPSFKGKLDGEQHVAWTAVSTDDHGTLSYSALGPRKSSSQLRKVRGATKCQCQKHVQKTICSSARQTPSISRSCPKERSASEQGSLASCAIT